MSEASKVQIDVQAKADAGPLEKFGLSLKDLQTLLKQAQNDFAAAAPGTAEYTAAVAKVGELSQRISEVIRPVREYAENQAKAAAETAKATAAMQQETQAVKAAEEAQKALNRAKREQQGNQRQDAVANAHRQFAADLREAEQGTARLALASRRVNEEQRKTPAVQEAAAASTRNSGAAVLAFSQGLEDVQYGIRGVLNNIPGLVMSLGGGMGLAGVISVAAVALSVLTEWFGKTKEAGEKVNWASLTPDEAAIQRQEKFNQKLRDATAIIDAQAAAWKRQGEALKAATDRQKEHDEYLDKKAKQSGIEGDPQQTLTDYDTRTRRRQEGLAVPEQEATAAQVDAERRAADAAAKEQARRSQDARVKDLEKLGAVEKQIAEQQKRVNGAQAKLAMAEGGSQGMLPSGDRARMQADIQKERDALKRLQESQRQIVGPDVKLTGDQEKDAEARKNAMDRERGQAAKLLADEKAAREKAIAAEITAQEKAKALADARAKAAEDQENDADATEQQVAREAGLPAPLPVLPGEARNAGGRMDLLDPKTRGLITKAEQPGPEPESTYGPEYEAEQKRLEEEAAVNETAGKLRESIAADKVGGMKPMLEGLLAMLTDGQGDTQAELARIQEMFQTISSGKGQAVEELSRAMAAVAEMNRNTVGAIGRIADIIGAQSASIASVTQRITSLESTLRN